MSDELIPARGRDVDAARSAIEADVGTIAVAAIDLGCGTGIVALADTLVALDINVGKLAASTDLESLDRI